MCTGGRTDVGRALKTRMRPNARRSDPALTRRGSRERIVTKTPVPKDRMATRLGFDDPPSILTWQRVNSEIKKFQFAANIPRIACEIPVQKKHWKSAGYASTVTPRRFFFAPTRNRAREPGDSFVCLFSVLKFVRGPCWARAAFPPHPLSPPPSVSRVSQPDQKHPNSANVAGSSMTAPRRHGTSPRSSAFCSAGSVTTFRLLGESCGVMSPR